VVGTKHEDTRLHSTPTTMTLTVLKKRGGEKKKQKKTTSIIYIKDNKKKTTTKKHETNEKIKKIIYITYNIHLFMFKVQSFILQVNKQVKI